MSAFSLGHRHAIRVLLGVAAVLLFSTATRAQVTFTVLHAFDGADGTRPGAGLMQASDGDFYGTTTTGGASDYGTIFRVTSDGTLTVLHSFTGGAGGTYPVGPLIQATDGNLYGMTNSGGAASGGTVYKLDLNGGLTVLSSFDIVTKGILPQAGLVQGTDGDFYGTTEFGGPLPSGPLPFGAGTVFKVTANGVVTVLHTFAPTSSGTDGSYPFTGVVQATDGNFYGTTAGGGTLYKVTSSGVFTALYNLPPPPPSLILFPVATLVQATDGNVYGTATAGGATNLGSIFKLTPDGEFTTLYSFTGGADGKTPQAALIQGANGDFFGTTIAGGAFGYGTVFTVTSDGTLTVLYTFTGGADGATPRALMQAADGSLYGTTADGGTNGKGVVFHLSSAISITGTRSPGANAYGWNDSPVTATFQCSNALPGLAAGSPPAPTVVSTEGAGQSVTGTCTDLAGNSASFTVGDINIDLTGPAITASVNSSTLWPANGKMVPVIVSGTMTDALSGIKPGSATFTVIDEYGVVQPSGSIATGPDGTYAATVMLQASRLGNDRDGRRYQIIIAGSDRGGNQASTSTVITVPHDQRK